MDTVRITRNSTEDGAIRYEVLNQIIEQLRSTRFSAMDSVQNAGHGHGLSWAFLARVVPRLAFGALACVMAWSGLAWFQDTHTEISAGLGSKIAGLFLAASGIVFAWWTARYARKNFSSLNETASAWQAAGFGCSIILRSFLALGLVALGIWMLVDPNLFN